MKKFASLLLTVVLLATMLTVFAVPASAARRGGADRNNVGKWAYMPYGFQASIDRYYFIFDAQGFEYYLAEYSKSGSTYKKIGTTSLPCEDLSLKPTTDVPQAVRDIAAQDYPNLAPSGFTVSSGTWWIIAAGAVVIVGGVVAIIVANKKRKKPALASGAEITDDTEKPEE